MDKTQIIIALAAFYAGWKAKGYLDLILTHMFVRIVSSAFGKQAILEKLLEGVEKLQPKEPPHAG